VFNRRFPLVKETAPEVTVTLPVPFGVMTRLMAAFVPVPDQILLFKVVPVVTAAVMKFVAVMLATVGVRVPPMLSHVATPPLLETSAHAVPASLLIQTWPMMYPVSDVEGSRRAGIGVGNWLATG